MYKGKKILAIIPARGGSKGLPGKNIKQFCGKPLIAWTVETARKSRYIDSVFVSTDDRNIADISEKYGARVPFLRPRKYAADKTPAADVIKNVFHDFIAKSERYDVFVYLQPTSPLRLTEDIDSVVGRLSNGRIKAVVSVAVSEKSPLLMNVLPRNMNMSNFLKKTIANRNRQDFPEFYHPNGAIYMAYFDYFLKQGAFYGSGTYAYVMPKERSVDIDDIYDFKFAESIMKTRNL